MNCQQCRAVLPGDSKFCFACGTALSPPRPDHQSEAAEHELGREQEEAKVAALLAEAIGPEFRIERLIGRGGMAMVFLAREVALDRAVAVKVLPPSLTFGVGTERFVREAQVSAALSHPNIVAIHRVATGAGLVWYSMEYLTGRVLDVIVDGEGPLSVAATVAILRQVAAALDYAHERGIVHRDIKPGNIMVDDRGHVKVMDFGIAKAMAGGTLTGTGMIVGTPHFMSPEQLSGTTLSAAADQYSVGVVAYWMLSGRFPFDSDTVMSIMKAHMFDAPPPLGDIRQDLPVPVIAAVERALAKQPGARYPTVSAFVGALAGEASAEPRATRSSGRSSAPPDVEDAPERREQRTRGSSEGPGPARRKVERIFNMDTGIFLDATTLRESPPEQVTDDLVFLCYNHGADHAFALDLARHLKELGIPVWVDTWDIRPGRRWDEAIEEALNRCSHLLLVISPESLASHEVRDEFLMALDEGKTVVPVVHRQPASLHRRLRRIQHIDFSRRAPSDRIGLIKIVRALGLTDLVDLEPGDVAS